MHFNSLFRLLKQLTETILDWAEWSQVAATLGLAMISYAAVRVWFLPREDRLPAIRRAALWTALAMVVGAACGGAVFALTNLALMHLGGPDHLRHFHSRLVRQAAMTGAALGAGGAAVVATLWRRAPA